jgi:hypothetical protein
MINARVDSGIEHIFYTIRDILQKREINYDFKDTDMKLDSIIGSAIHLKMLIREEMKCVEKYENFAKAV